MKIRIKFILLLSLAAAALVVLAFVNLGNVRGSSSAGPSLLVSDPSVLTTEDAL